MMKHEELQRDIDLFKRNISESHARMAKIYKLKKYLAEKIFLNSSKARLDYLEKELSELMVNNVKVN